MNANSVKGIGLVEVMIALVIVGITVIGLILLQGISTTRPAAAAGIAEASSIAARLGMICKDSTSGTEAVSWLDNRYSVKWSAVSHKNPERQEITVTVSWLDIDGQERVVDMTSLALCSHAESGKLVQRHNNQIQN
jgi:hypothetical protein